MIIKKIFKRRNRDLGLDYKWIKYKRVCYDSTNYHKLIKRLKKEKILKEITRKMTVYEVRVPSDKDYFEVKWTSDLNEVIEMLEDDGMIEEDFWRCK